MGKVMLFLKIYAAIVAVTIIMVMGASASVQELSKVFAGNPGSNLSLFAGSILALVAAVCFIVLVALISVVTDKRREFRHASMARRFLQPLVKTIPRMAHAKKVRLCSTETMRSPRRRQSRNRRCQRVLRKEKRLRRRDI
jgi:hypothetical protein